MSIRSADGKRYVKSTLAQSDDYANANGKSVLSFSQAQELARKFANNLHHSDDLEDNKPYTVNNAVNDYLLDFKANGKKSFYSTETQINAHITPIFGEKLVSALSYKQLNAWKNKLATTDKRVRSSNKVNQIQKYLIDDKNDPEYQRKRRAVLTESNHIVQTAEEIVKAVASGQLSIKEGRELALLHY